MIRFCLAAILLASCVTAQSQDRWLHVSGRSWHDQPGYNGHNWGLGLEHRINQRWSAAAGMYHNSLDRTTAYGLIKHHWWHNGAAQININLGLATGYDLRPAAPVVLPELCAGWVCGLFVPAIGANTTSALALYLRIPIW